MKRLFSFLLTIVLLFSVFTFNTQASELYTEYDVSISCELDYSVESKDLFLTQNQYFYKTSAVSNSFTSYSTLNNLQKQIYDSFLNAGIGTLTVPMDFEYGDFPVENFNQEFFYEIMEAIALDNPQIYYFAGNGITDAYVYADGKYIAKFNFNVSMFSNSTYAENELVANYNALMSKVKNAPIDTSNRYNFVESVHDYLCIIGTYPDLDSSDYTGNSHDAYGCLVENKPVCQGYADAFKLFCNYYKIPCVCIGGKAAGGNHMWNAVQMDDGKWYLIDITWDDQDAAGVFYDFFLSGTDTKASRAFNYGVFKETHQNNPNIYLPSLCYSTEKYSETNHNTAFKATYNSLAKEEGNYLIRSFFDVDNSYVYYNGMYVETNNLTTNGVFSVPIEENKNSENWTLVLLGDCTGDGVCDNLDYSDAVNKVLADTDVTTSFDMAADIDCDGYLDVIDLSLLSLAANGLDTNLEIE